MKRPKVCIFCGTRGGISKEHFWPQWLAAHLTPANPNLHVSELHLSEGKQPPRLERRSERPGGVHTKKIRAVCATCNNGWMSTLESKVKPVILGLLDRSGTVLSSESTANLALWVAVKSIVGEYAIEGTALTTAADRSAMFAARAIPAYFRIFVAFHSLQTQAGYYRQSTTISTSMRGPCPTLPPGIFRNIQATTFFVGPVCVYLTAVRAAGFNGAAIDPPSRMHRLWPDPATCIDLDGLLPLGWLEIQSIGTVLDRLVAHPRLKYGGPLPRQSECLT